MFQLNVVDHNYLSILCRVPQFCAIYIYIYIYIYIEKISFDLSFMPCIRRVQGEEASSFEALHTNPASLDVIGQQAARCNEFVGSSM
jgi:hypothetical protein